MQDTCPAPGSVCRTQKLAPGTANSGKNRIRKTEIQFQGGPKKNFDRIFLQLILGCGS